METETSWDKTEILTSLSLEIDMKLNIINKSLQLILNFLVVTYTHNLKEN